MRLVVPQQPLKRILRRTRHALLAGAVAMLGYCGFVPMDTWVFPPGAKAGPGGPAQTWRSAPQPGNVGISGRRKRYRVVSTKVAGPYDVAALNPTGNEIFTLVICYRLYFVGSAPDRFIVRAERAGNAS
jgi:hypothetical protein